MIFPIRSDPRWRWGQLIDLGASRGANPSLARSSVLGIHVWPAQAPPVYPAPTHKNKSGWWFGTCLFHCIPCIGSFIIPTDELRFSRGVQTTNQKYPGCYRESKACESFPQRYQFSIVRALSWHFFELWTWVFQKEGSWPLVGVQSIFRVMVFGIWLWSRQAPGSLEELLPKETLDKDFEKAPWSTPTADGIGSWWNLKMTQTWKSDGSSSHHA